MSNERALFDRQQKKEREEFRKYGNLNSICSDYVKDWEFTKSEHCYHLPSYTCSFNFFLFFPITKEKKLKFCRDIKK